MRGVESFTVVLLAGPLFSFPVGVSVVVVVDWALGKIGPLSVLFRHRLFFVVLPPSRVDPFWEWVNRPWTGDLGPVAGVEDGPSNYPGESRGRPVHSTGRLYLWLHDIRRV